MRQATNGGFTLIEALIVMLVFLPLINAIVSTNQVVVGTIDTNERSAESSELLRTTTHRIAQFVRPGSLSSCKVRATAADVAAAQAAKLLDPLVHVPAVGELISPQDLDPRPGLQFRSALGLPAINASALSEPREFSFLMDAAETANSNDDDGDGLVDEGKLILQYGSTMIVLLDQVEVCTFELDQRIVKIRLRCARRDKRGVVHRAFTEQQIAMRNN